jgi:hypothetical protein
MVVLANRISDLSPGGGKRNPHWFLLSFIYVHACMYES